MGKSRKQPGSAGADRGAERAPRSAFAKGNERRPRGPAPGPGAAPPLWAYRIVDLGGPWCWSRLDGAGLREVLQRLKELESMTWAAIESGTGSHFIDDLTKLCRRARERLVEIRQDDAATLFSLRLTGRRRIWGIRDAHVLRILWWDPEHEVYPSAKKHT